MKIPHVLCIRCERKIVGPFDPRDEMPERCPHCGEMCYGDEGGSRSYILGIKEVGMGLPDAAANPLSADKTWAPDDVAKLEGSVQEMFEKLEELSKTHAKPGKEKEARDLVATLRRNYAEARTKLPSPFAELAVLGAAQEVMWMLRARTPSPRGDLGMLN